MELVSAWLLGRPRKGFAIQYGKKAIRKATSGYHLYYRLKHPITQVISVASLRQDFGVGQRRLDPTEFELRFADRRQRRQAGSVAIRACSTLVDEP